MAAVLVPRSSRLHRAAVTADTHKRYYNATRDFVHWAQQNKEEPANIEELDETLNEYIHWMFDNGGSKDAAYKALYGTMHFLLGAKNRSTFPFSRKSMRGWTKLYPPRAWSPLTWELCCAIAFQFVRARRPEYAVAVLVAFDGMFRCGELLNIRVGDLGMDESGHIGVRLPKQRRVQRNTRGFASQLFRKFCVGGSRASDLMQNYLSSALRRFVVLSAMFATDWVWTTATLSTAADTGVPPIVHGDSRPAPRNDLWPLGSGVISQTLRARRQSTLHQEQQIFVTGSPKGCCASSKGHCQQSSRGSGTMWVWVVSAND